MLAKGVLAKVVLAALEAELVSERERHKAALDLGAARQVTLAGYL